MKDKGIQVIDNTDEGSVMDIKIQVRKDANHKIMQGMVLGNTLEQNKAFLMIAQPGDLKAEPTLGIGFHDNLLSDDLLEYRHKVRREFARDGLKVTKLDLYHLENINIQADYE